MAGQQTTNRHASQSNSPDVDLTLFKERASTQLSCGTRRHSKTHTLGGHHDAAPPPPRPLHGSTPDEQLPRALEITGGCVVFFHVPAHHIKRRLVVDDGDDGFIGFMPQWVLF